MKLVDILARELTEWAGDVGAITQDKLTGELLDYYHCPLRGGNEREVSSIADDAGEAHDGASGAAVTRADWQAAVDALNAPKVVAWDGVGLPPVGIYVQTSHGVVQVTAYSPDNNWVLLWVVAESLPSLVKIGDHDMFRPIRTAEQVADDEREKAIDEMVNDFGKYFVNPRVSARTIYDAGYRKEPKPCGS